MKRLLVFLVCLGLWSEAEAANFPMIRCTIVANTVVNTTTQPIPNAECGESGDLIIVTIGVDGVNTTTWPSATYCEGDAFTVLQADTSDSVNAHTHAIRYCVLDAAMTGTNNIGTNSEQAEIIVVVIVKGSYTGVPEAGTPFAQGTADTVVDPPSLTPSWGSADNLWIVSVANDGAGRPETSRSATDAGWNLHSHYLQASTTGAGAAMFFHFETAASLDPANTMLVLSQANEHSENTIAIKGQAIPAAGGTPACLITSIDTCHVALGE